MNKQMRDTLQRRTNLLAKIAVQREQIKSASARCEVPLAVADQGLAAVRYVRSHPLILIGVVALVSIRRSGVAGMAGNALRLWKLYKFTRNFSAKIVSRL